MTQFPPSAGAIQPTSTAASALEQARSALEQKTEDYAQALAMMKATLDSSTDGILVTDARFHVTAWNASFVRMWQRTESALRAEAPDLLMDELASYFADPGALRNRLQAILQEAHPGTVDELKPRDGRTVELHSCPQVVKGRVTGRVWTFRDVSTQRRAEEALHEQTRALELINHTGRSLAAELDLRALVQAVTDAGTKISGAAFGAFFYTVADAKGDTMLLYTLSGAPREAFERFGHPRDTALFGPTFKGQPAIRIDDVLKDPRYGRSEPHRGMPAGHLPVRSYMALPVVARSGEVVGGLFFGHPDPGVFTERSEKILVGIAAQAAIGIDNARLYESAQRSAEERRALLERERAARTLAEQMSALKDDFLATLSHELRTPVSAILGWVHILRRGARSPEDLQKGLDTIERSSRVQIQLINDLLDMNRVALGKVRLEVQSVAPVSFIEAAMETMLPAAEAKGVRVEPLLDPSGGLISGDPGRLQQIMVNLLSNAVKFTPRGGTVRVRLECVGSQVVITVADTGIGIKPEFVDHVFERFRQADSSTTRRYGGLGLGLAIARSLAELHGGSVSATSAGEGMGATFTVQLPLPVQADAGARAHACPPPHGPVQVAAAFQALDLSGLKILVVDDDADGRELVLRVLGECQAQVLVAGDAAEALRLVSLHRPDVVVSDIGMPEVDGLELLRRIRALDIAQGGAVPAIALTAFTRPQDRDQALVAGFVAHLSKPVEPAHLLDAVARAAGRRAEATPVALHARQGLCP